MTSLSGPLSAVGMTHHFVVHIDNSSYDLGTWSRVTGLAVSWNPCEYRVGDAGNQYWVLPGTTRYQNIKLSRAACQDSQTVQQWLVTTSTNPVPLTGKIMLAGSGGSPVVSWRLSQFFPIGWSIVDFDADLGQTAIETLELAHAGFLDDEASPGY